MRLISQKVIFRKFLKSAEIEAKVEKNEKQNPAAKAKY